MKVTVIGAGNMGSAFVKQLIRAGHQVGVTARDAAKAARVAAANPGATAVATAGSAVGADAVVLATSYADAVDALKTVGDLQGKVVIDITNPLTADYMGLTIGHTTSAAEEIAKSLPGLRSSRRSTPCSPRCSPKERTSAPTRRSPCSMPATANAPSRRHVHWPRAWASEPSMPVA